MILLAASSVAAAMVLLASGVWKVARSRELGAILAEQRMPPRWQAVTRAALPAAELGTGLATLLGWFLAFAVGGGEALLRVSHVLMGVVGVALTVHVVRLATRPSPPRCGCLGASERVGRATVLRAGFLAAAGTSMTAWAAPVLQAAEQSWPVTAGVAVLLALVLTVGLRALSPASDTVRARH